ncbi:hypothetical protein [Mesonia aestuariivivens]|uniref:Uncharacterized protein n=1 Tax=Mesonia aestuariivivens TaxID=2796128 RepID=A0ABS6W4D4_9FLAO|nr:hypothetical protein [Mesonia aestuariivivens]MBW2961949.1 hypothetical protein [Mesonia aestuariivivens]
MAKSTAHIVAMTGSYFRGDSIPILLTEVEEERQHIVVDSVIKNGSIEEQGDRRFIKMADTFVNIDEIHIDLIDSVNPFQKAFEILSKSVTAPVFKNYPRNHRCVQNSNDGRRSYYLVA